MVASLAARRRLRWNSLACLGKTSACGVEGTEIHQVRSGVEHIQVQNETSVGRRWVNHGLPSWHQTKLLLTHGLPLGVMSALVSCWSLSLGFLLSFSLLFFFKLLCSLSSVGKEMRDVGLSYEVYGNYL